MYTRTLLTILGLFLFVASGYSQQWTFATRFGGTSAGFSDAVKAICTDASGNVYATGNFNASINFGNGTSTLTATAGGTATDGFVAKFNASGLCQWAIRFGGSATDQGGLGIATDGTTVYVTGQSQFPATISATALATVGGGTDGVVFALNASTGAVNWAKAFGGGATTDAGQAICLDAAGHVYISGIFSTRTSNPTASFGAAGAFNRTVQGNMSQATSDMFVARLNAATGAFDWVSAGGAASQETPQVIGNDNISGSGIAYIPALNQLVVTGSFNEATATYYSNGSSAPSFSLTNSGQTDICVIKLDVSGNFISGIAAGGTSLEEGLAVAYDATTSAAYITGYFHSTTVTGACTLTNSSPNFDEIFYARYNPVSNAIDWAKSASGATDDMAFSIAANGSGQLYITGRYQGTISFPTATTPLTASSSGSDDIFLLTAQATSGNALLLARGNGATGTDAGLAVATSTNADVWVGGIFAGTTVSFVPSSPAVSVTAALDQELFIARYNNPPPSITTQPQPSTACAGLPAGFTVAASGTSLNYQWQQSVDAAFTSPVTLTNTGIYSTVTTAALNISDNTTVNGKYYRVIISNNGGSVTSNAVLLTAAAPSLPLTNTNTTQAVNTSNNLYYTGACLLIDKVVPSGASAVTGNVTSQVWVENTVPAFATLPFVQRHYQITPATNSSTATATITLYFTQAEFDAFNAAPGSVLDLPTGPGDAAGIANLRIGKYSGSSTDGSGLPGTYTSGASVIDPADAKIVWNATNNYWEVTFDVSGFSGFIVQTNTFALPLDLLSFSADLTGNDVHINWKTTNEQDQDHFELQRSTGNGVFTTVATIAALSGSNNNYDYTDNNAASSGTSKLFYRLKMVSLAGSVEYSTIVMVVPDKTNELITNVVNPFRKTIQFNLHTSTTGKLAIMISDVNGRLLLRENRLVPKGFSTQLVNEANKLTAGIYICTMVFADRKYTFKIIKLAH